MLPKNPIATMAPPLAVWLTGLAVFTVLGVDGLFVGDNPAFVVARVTVYVSVGTMAALVLAFAALFGVACGLMLNWLGDAASTREIAVALAKSSWCVAAYIWLGVVLLLVEPPAAVSVFDVANPHKLESHLEETTAFVWMGRVRYVAMVCFVALAAWFLARRVKPWNAVIAVAFAAAALAAISTGLGLLTGSTRI